MMSVFKLSSTEQTECVRRKFVKGVIYISFIMNRVFHIGVKTTATGISGHFSTNIIQVLPCFSLSCKEIARI
jgi:hypothetical protein